MRRVAASLLPALLVCGSLVAVSRGDDDPAPAPPAAKDPPAAPAAAAPAGEAAALPAPEDDAAAVAALSKEERARRLDGALAEISKALADLRSLRAQFEQRKHLEVFGEEVVSRGSLALRFPGRLRWEYREPLRTVLVVSGDRVRRERTSRRGETTSETARLVDDPVTSATAEQVFLWTRGDFAKARERYDLELVSTTPLVVRAAPRDATMAKVIEAVDLTFDSTSRALTAIVLREKTRSRTEIRFLDVERNPELGDGLFDVEDRKK